MKPCLLFSKYRLLLYFFLSASFFVRSQSTIVTFSPTGATQTFVIPPCVSTLTVVTRGAGGDNGGWGGGTATNLTAAITPTTGVVFYINVGSMGSGTLGGFNGGGNGGVGSSSGGGGGGGATDIRIGGNTLADRILVSGGGGGAGGNSYTSAHGGDANSIFSFCPAPNGYGIAGGSGTGSNSFLGGGCNGSTLTAYGSGGGGGGMSSGGGVTGALPGGFGGAGLLGIGGKGGDYNASSGGSVGGVYGGGGGGGGYYGGAGGMSGAYSIVSNFPENGGGGAGSAYINTVICTYLDEGGMWPGQGTVIIEYIQLGQLPVVAASSSSICSGASVTFSVSNAATCNWLANGSFVGSTNTIVSVSPGSSSIYTVITTNTFGCIANNTIAINVIPTPSSVPVASPASVCSGGSATLSASGASAYSWSPIPGNTSTLIVTPGITTIYTLVAANSSCSSTHTLVLAVNPNPTVTINASQILICRGQSVQLSAGGAVSYIWNTMQVAATITVSPQATSSYLVIGSDANVCKNTASIVVQVSDCTSINEMREAPVFNVFPNPNTGEFFISAPSALKLMLYNDLGQAMRSIYLNVDTLEEKITGLAPGVYFLVSTGNPQNLCKRIVITD